MREFKGIEKSRKYAKEKSSSSVFREAHERDFLAGYNQALKDSKAAEMLQMLKKVYPLLAELHLYETANNVAKLIKEATKL